MPDHPKSLKDPSEIAARKKRLDEKHVKPLTEFVRKIRRERRGYDVPYFDPLDGGVRAKCLFMLESPGRMTKKMGCGVRRGGRVGSGFVSRNNNDETAKNFFEANEVAKLPRKWTVTWNIVPWDLSKDGQKQPPTKAEIELGLTSPLSLRSVMAVRRRLASGRKIGRRKGAEG